MEGHGSRLADTHQHNEILANKTILTLNLKQVARSRHSAQWGAEGGEKRRSQGTGQDDSNPKNTSLKFKIAFIILTFQWADCPLPARAFVKYLFFGLDRRIYLLACALAAGASAANECKDQDQDRLDGCPEGPLQRKEIG